MRYSEILNEMIVRREGDKSKDVIAFRDTIFLINSMDDIDSISDEMKEQIEKKTGLDLSDYIEYDSRPDIVFGTINNDILYLYNSPANGMGPNPKSSIFMKKIIEKLGLDGVEYTHLNYQGGDDNIQMSRGAMEGRIPDMVYHGTNSSNLRGLLTTGLTPGKGNANWLKSVGRFEDRVFLTVSFENAQFHAITSAEKQRSIPLIIQTKIPDRDRIIPDFDMTSTYSGPYSDKAISHGYTDAISQQQFRDTLPDEFLSNSDYTRETGIMAYRGRVPASFFVKFFIPDNLEISEIEQFYPIDNQRDLIKAIELLDEFGHFEPYMLDEMDYEEDEDY